MGEGRSRVASHDAYALDQHGVRRFIRAGDELPPGWRWEQPPEEDKPKPKNGRRKKRAA
jgi:hypothetical protein